MELAKVEEESGASKDLLMSRDATTSSILWPQDQSQLLLMRQFGLPIDLVF